MISDLKEVSSRAIHSAHGLTETHSRAATSISNVTSCRDVIFFCLVVRRNVKDGIKRDAVAAAASATDALI